MENIEYRENERKIRDGVNFNNTQESYSTLKEFYKNYIDKYCLNDIFIKYKINKYI